MSFLTPDNIRNITIAGEPLVINEKIIPDNARAPRQIATWVPRGGPMKPNRPLSGDGRPRGITVHNTNDITVPSGTNPAEQYTRATWPNANMAGVVVHFYVWRREIWQNLDLSEQGWHASDGTSRRASKRAGQQIGGNVDTIAIEAIGDHAETTQTTALLTAWLLRHFELNPNTDVYTHNFFLGQAERIVPGARKNCPIFILPNLDSFMQTVRDMVVAPVVDNTLPRQRARISLASYELPREEAQMREHLAQIRAIPDFADAWPVITDME